MMNIGAGEIAVIAILALLILGPTRLPEFARGIGKFIREFRRQTDDVRNTVEREFYKMDRDVGMNVDVEPPKIVPMTDIAPRDGHADAEAAAHEATPPAALPATTSIPVTAANANPAPLEAEPTPTSAPDASSKTGAA